MKRRSLARVVSPVNVSLIGIRVGSTVAKAVLSTAVAGQLRPEVIGEAILSSSSIRSHVQVETLHIIALRLSGRVPRHLHWLLHIVTEYLHRRSSGEALRSLSERTLRYHVTAFGLRGMTASAIAAAAVQLSIATCYLATSNARAYWCRHRRHPNNHTPSALCAKDGLNKEGPDNNEPFGHAASSCFPRRRCRCCHSRMSVSQYRYDAMTVLYSALMTVVGSGVGAALGSMVLPGFGTALGSIVCSSGCGLLPSYVRREGGPDHVARRQSRQLADVPALRVVEEKDDVVEMSYAERVVLVERRARQSKVDTGHGDDMCNHGRDTVNDKDDNLDDVGNSCCCACVAHATCSSDGYSDCCQGEVAATTALGEECGNSNSSGEMRCNDSYVILDACRVPSPHDSAPSPYSSMSSLSSSFSSCSSSWSQADCKAGRDRHDVAHSADTQRHEKKTHTRMHRHEGSRRVATPADTVEGAVAQSELSSRAAVQSQLCFARASDVQAVWRAVDARDEGEKATHSEHDIDGLDAMHEVGVHEMTNAGDTNSAMERYRGGASTALPSCRMVCDDDDGDAFQRQIMCGQVECIEGKSSWDEIDAVVDGFGEDEIVLLFAAQKAPS